MATEPPPFSPTPPPYSPPPAPGGTGMVDRIKNILLSPKTEWDRIDAEPMTEQGIFTSWVLPLAAIGPVCSFIGGQVFGYGAFGIVYKPPLVAALVTAILTFALAVGVVWVIAKIIDALAPNFGGTKNPIAATKVAAFSYTASFLAGVFGIIPMLGMLAILGLYSFYLLYVGLPKLMKAPQDKAIGYTVVTVLVGVVCSIVIGVVAGAATAMVAPAALMSATAGTTSGTLNVPGGSVDLAKLEAASKQIETQAKAMEASANAAAAGNAAAVNGAVKVADPNALAALLPTMAAGWNRTTIESSGAGAAGVGGSTAKGEYSLGANSATLSVTDMGAMGAIAALGSAFNVQSNKTTSTGYEKAGTVDGRMTSEKWDSGTKHGNYSTIVANRFVVEVDGQADSVDALKALAGSVNQGTLAGMAK